MLLEQSFLGCTCLRDWFWPGNEVGAEAKTPMNIHLKKSPQCIDFLFVTPFISQSLPEVHHPIQSQDYDRAPDFAIVAMLKPDGHQ